MGLEFHNELEEQVFFLGRGTCMVLIIGQSSLFGI